MALQDLPGSSPKGRFKIERSNLERAENDANAEAFIANGRQPQKFPMHVHKPGKLVREVENEQQLADAVAKGWFEDIRDVPEPESTDAPTKVSEMTLAQAAEFIAKATPAELAAIEQDEASHGGRAKVMQLIDDAKDAVVTKPKAKPKAK